MSTFREVFEQIRRESKGSKDLGDRFELLMVQYFKRDRQYDWEYVRLWPKQDLGIDIVARDKFGEMWAIQCKGYKESSVLEYEGNVTNLWPEADANKIPNKIIVTTARPSVNLDKQCRRTGTRIIRYADLESSGIEWSADLKKIRARSPRPLRPYQDVAMSDCIEGFRSHDRGQLIMACGTGKTLTALHIAERQAGKGGLVLYLVPSISLVKQSMHDWAEDANIRHQYMAVCSDSTVKEREDISVTDLTGAVTTNPDTLKKQYGMTDKNAMQVIFCTYHSAEVVSQAFASRTFDLIIFDEAHRTAGREGKSFGLAHHDGNIQSKKRLYMTATPRTYKIEGATEGYSMDDRKIFGKRFHELKFSKAIDDKILSDYKVVGLSVLAEDLDKARADAGEDVEFTLEEECKLASIYGAIRQQEEDREPNLLRRILVFHNKIPQSKRFEMAFPKIVEKVNKREGLNTTVVVQHVDNTSRAKGRSSIINWLRGNGTSGVDIGADTSEPDVKVVSNVRCLSEGVDVPALDGVVFCEPRQSVVDVIQAVGRVMRRTSDKSDGYVIVPVVASRNEAIESVIGREKSNRLILQIAEALRAHDNRIDRFFNQAALYPDPSVSGGSPGPGPVVPPQIAEIFDVLPATLLKAGFYWDEYGRRMGERAAVVAMQARNRSESIYNSIISALHNNLKNVVGDTVTRNDTIDAVAQHLVLRPVFETLFGRSENPVWRAFDHVVDQLDFRKELEELDDWHKLMKYHVENITSPQAKQNVIAKIYGNFFLGFDPQQAKTIVYTPVEIVDFIIHSIQHVLETEFGTDFTGESVKVLDPFAGTGIFLARLMESGHIPDDYLTAKYHNMDFGEIKLLAYYTACANLETTHAKRTGHTIPYKRGCLVDTFTIRPDWRSLKAEGKAHEQVKITDPDFARVHQMRDDQQSSHIHVIMGNPPYSGGRKSGNERVQNTSHPNLEARIVDTYQSKIPKHIRQKRATKNPYVKAFRWASDRIGKSGVIGFITPSAWISGDAQVGIRACLMDEFTDVWCFDLLGQKGKSGHGRNIFEYKGKSEGGSTEATAITILVKNPAKSGCTIHYASLTSKDYTGDQKRAKVKELGDISNVPWGEPIDPDKHHDWLNQRGSTAEMWEKLPSLGSDDGKKGTTEEVVFRHYFPGLGTGRDAWVYNSSVTALENNMKRHIDYCNSQDLDNFSIDPKQAKWNTYLRKQLIALRKHNKQPKFDKSHIKTSLYKPFFKQYLYYDKTFVEVHQVGDYFPNDVNNASILVPDKTKSGFTAIITNTTPDRGTVDHSQVFPFKTKIQIDEKLGPVASSKLQAPSSKLQAPSENLALIIPDKIKEFSAFITNVMPDRHVVETCRIFPLRTME